MPGKLELHEMGEITGVVAEQGEFKFTVQATGQNSERSAPKKLALKVETPLKTNWSRKAQVNGNRIEGSIKGVRVMCFGTSRTNNPGPFDFPNM